MGWLNVLLALAISAGQAPQLPPPFPRPGTTLLLENDVVAVWNVSWLKQHTRCTRTGTTWSACPTPKAIASLRRGPHPGDSSTPKRGCFRPTAPASRTSRRARAIRRMRAVLIEVKPPRRAQQPRSRQMASARSSGRPPGKQSCGSLAGDAGVVGSHASPRRRRG